MQLSRYRKNEVEKKISIFDSQNYQLLEYGIALRVAGYRWYRFILTELVHKYILSPFKKKNGKVRESNSPVIGCYQIQISQSECGTINELIVLNYWYG